MVADHFGVVKAAAVQASSVLLDREASTQKACELIREAGANGAEFVVFPEGFLPGHPSWFHFHPATSRLAHDLNVELFKNAVIAPGPETEQLARAAGDAGAYVVIGVCERPSATSGSMFNTQLYFSPDGRYLGKHQKLMPTVGERIVHAYGWGDTLGCFETGFGPASSLVCGENSNPLAMFALIAGGTRVHAMSWPPHFMLAGKGTPDMPDTALVTARAFALSSKAFVVSASGVVDDDYFRKLEVPDALAARLRTGEGQGGSVIVAPSTEVIGGPLEGGVEGIVYAEMDMDLWVRLKLIQDFSGHYNRPEILRLQVDRTGHSHTATAASDVPAGSRDEPSASLPGGLSDPAAAVRAVDVS